MANRECYPASLFPLRGDLNAEAGATTVEVIGIRKIPIDKPITDGTAPIYVAADGRIEWGHQLSLFANEYLVSDQNAVDFHAGAGVTIVDNGSGMLTFSAVGGGGGIDVNGSPVSSPNLQDSATVTFSVVGSDIQATAAGGGGNFADAEVPTGTNPTFTLAHAPSPAGSLQLWGLSQIYQASQGFYYTYIPMVQGFDYTLSGNTITVGNGSNGATSLAVFVSPLKEAWYRY